MSARIGCPYCGHEMTLKTPKAGRYKPTCTACKKPFALVIEEGEPLKVKIGKIAEPKIEAKQAIHESETKPAADPGSTKSTPKTSVATPETPTVHIPKPDGEKTVLFSSEQNALTMDGDSRPARSEQGVSKTTAAMDVTIDQAGSKHDSAPAMQRTMDAYGTLNQATRIAGTQDLAVTMDGSSNPPGATGAFSIGTGKKTQFPQGATRMESRASGVEGVPDRLGGYRILSELGRGGMGSVYLAKQLSLDRRVALKTIQAAWASNPRVIARFIREAYAAAQLTHHNVVQIYDLGEDRGTNFFSMELVGGGSLDDLLRQNGKLDPRTAASYILQAARGLKFAHDHGMVHRDVKPANLMLSMDSLVKVADLGLVKTAGPSDDSDTAHEDRSVMLASAHSNVTGAGSTMGTPAYMSPEQADDAANVDLRADIYSLGCTFYALLTGKPPFASDSALDVITKHKTAVMERPDKVVTGIPQELGSIVERMTAKQAKDRYQDLADTIRDLERFLSGSASQGASPSTLHAEILENSAKEFRNVPAVKLRSSFPWIIIVCVLVLVGISSIFSWRLATSFLVMLVATPVFCNILSTFQLGANPIGSRLRSNLMNSSLGDWITWSFGALLVAVIAFALGLVTWWLVALGMAVAVAFVYLAIVQKPLMKQRRGAIERTEGMLRELRLMGIDEKAIQRFVAEFSGKHWEEFFETLFDYDSMRQARRQLASDGRLKGRQRFQIWRDWIVDRLEERIEATRQAKTQRVLMKVEQASLKATGVSENDAKQQAEDFAASMVSVATEARFSARMDGVTTDDPIAKRERFQAMLQAARTGKPKSIGSIAKKTTGALLNHLVGGKLRFAVGAFMVIGCVLWANQNQLFNPEKLERLSKSVSEQVSKTVEQKDLSKLAAEGQALSSDVGREFQGAEPLKLPIVGPFFNSFAPGFMGLMVLSSCILYGWRYSLFALPAAAVVLIGPAMPGISNFGFAPWICFGAAVGILGIGLLLGRQRAY